MSMIADFIVATPEEALAYAGRFDDLESYDEDDEASVAAEDRLEQLEAIERLQMNGLTGLAMGLLWADLLGVPWDVRTHMPRTVGSGENWLLDHLEPPLLDAVVSVPDGRVGPALDAWLSREDMRGWEAELAREFFVDLQALARSARAQGKGVYLFNPF